MEAPTAKRSRLERYEEDAPVLSNSGASHSAAIPFVLLTRKLTPWQWDRILKLVAAGFDAHVVQDSSIDDALSLSTPSRIVDRLQQHNGSVLGKRGRPEEGTAVIEDAAAAATREALQAGRLHHIPDEALFPAGYHDINTRAVRKAMTAWERGVYWAADRFAHAAPAGSAAARAGLRAAPASTAAGGSGGIPRGVLGGCGRDALAELQARSSVSAAQEAVSEKSASASSTSGAASSARTSDEPGVTGGSVEKGTDAAAEPRVFFAEDDAQWTDAASLHALCSNILSERPAAHLVAEKIAWTQAEDPGWPSWGQGYRYFKQQHLAAAFVPFCCLSSRLLRDIRAFAAEHNTLIYLEILFVSLAKRGGLPVRFYRGGPRPLPVASRWRPDFTDAEIAAALAGQTCPRLTDRVSSEPGGSSAAATSGGASSGAASSDAAAAPADDERRSSTGLSMTSGSGASTGSDAPDSAAAASGPDAPESIAFATEKIVIGAAVAATEASADGDGGAATSAAIQTTPASSHDAASIADADSTRAPAERPAAAATAPSTVSPALPTYTVLFHPIKREPGIWAEWEAGRPLLPAPPPPSVAARSALPPHMSRIIQAAGYADDI